MYNYTVKVKLEKQILTDRIVEIAHVGIMQFGH